VTGWPSLLVSMCDAVSQHAVTYSSKLFSCIVTKRMPVIEFSATTIDITVQPVGFHPYIPPGLCHWTSVPKTSKALPPNHLYVANASNCCRWDNWWSESVDDV